MRRDIVHVVTKLDVGGAQTHVVELAAAQAASGHRVRVLAGVGGPAAARLGELGLEVELVPELGASHGRLSQRAAVAAVRSALAAWRPDLVHSHSSNAGLAARLATRKLAIPSVYTAHGWPFQKGAPTRQRVVSYAGELLGGRIGDAVIVLTQAEYDRAVQARVVARPRLFIVPNGLTDVDVAQRRTTTPPAGPPRIVMVARFAPPKRQAELIGVLADLRDLGWTVSFVGDGPGLAAAESAVVAHGLEHGRVRFLGHRDDVAAVLSESDIGVLWSRYEGLPISVIEYLRAGLCCVASDLPGTRELLADGAAGVLAGSADQLRAELGLLLTDPNRVDRFGVAGRGRFVEHYSAAVMAERVDAVYDSITAP